MPNKPVSVPVFCLTEQETISVPVDSNTCVLSTVETLLNSGKKLVCQRIGGHHRKVSIVDASNKPLTSSETGDFEGSLPRTTGHVLAIWSAMACPTGEGDEPT